MEIFPLHLSDFYKVSHADQYPKDTEVIYSNLTARSSRIDGISEVIFFGLQYFIKEYLQNQFQTYFFGLHDQLFDKLLRNYKNRLDCALGGDHDVSRWRDLKNLGYLPLEIKALPEGAMVPLRVPLLTVRNTRSEFFWLGQWMETLLSNVIWKPITTATIAYQYRKLFDDYAKETSDIPEFTSWQGHDFSFRGMSSVDDAAAGGAGHLLSFTGTDTIHSIDFLERYYVADASQEVIGQSVPATEHSVMTVFGEDGEFEMFRRLITEVYPSGIVSIVSDSYNLFKVLTEYLPRLKNEILNRNGKVVIRPDSGDPVKIICGHTDPFTMLDSWTPKDCGVIRLLDQTFGSTINSKGYKQLNPKVGAIYGDSITLERGKAICEGLKQIGYASTNMIFGIGSFTYQYVTRDTFGLAFKATAIRRNGVWHEMFKNPITDNGMKKSARGLLMVLPETTTNGQTGTVDLSNYKLRENVTEEEEASAWNMLQPVFRDGRLLKEYTLKEIRQRLYS